MITNKTMIAPFAGWAFGAIVFSIGMLNLLFVHAVPGNIFLLLSFLYFPPAADYFKERFGIIFPTWIKFILGLLILWFTLGVSDLGDLMDNWAL